MEKGTILYVGGFELPDKNAAAQRIVGNAKLFRDIGYKVVLLDSCRGQTLELEDKPKCFGFDRWSIRKSSKQLYSINKIIDVIKKQNNVAAVIAYNYPAVGLNKLRKYCAKKNIKIIADVTEWYGAQGKNIVHRIIKGLDSYYRMNIIQPKLDGVIAISRYLENYYKDKTNTVFLPPLTDSTDDKWNQPIVKRENNKLSILYAGTPGRDKDKLNLILRALNQCDNVKYLFKVIGITQEQYLTHYPEDTELIKMMADNVEFLGRKTHVEVIRELKAADFSLFYREVTRVTMAGFPTKFAEAITAGTPVLTNKTSDLDNYLLEGENGFWVDDIQKDLPIVLSKEYATLINLKNKVKKDIFDYRLYIENLSIWLERIF